MLAVLVAYLNKMQNGFISVLLNWKRTEFQKQWVTTEFIANTNTALAIKIYSKLSASYSDSNIRVSFTQKISSKLTLKSRCEQQSKKPMKFPGLTVNSPGDFRIFEVPKSYVQSTKKKKYFVCHFSVFPVLFPSTSKIIRDPAGSLSLRTSVNVFKWWNLF